VAIVHCRADFSPFKLTPCSFRHRESSQYEQLETFNGEIVAQEVGNEEYLHLKSKDDEYEHLESNMPKKPAPPSSPNPRGDDMAAEVEGSAGAMGDDAERWWAAQEAQADQNLRTPETPSEEGGVTHGDAPANPDFAAGGGFAGGWWTQQQKAPELEMLQSPVATELYDGEPLAPIQTTELNEVAE
jgi:hypothetical protein